jgi:hypothetical protein
MTITSHDDAVAVKPAH